MGDAQARFALLERIFRPLALSDFAGDVLDRRLALKDSRRAACLNEDL